MGLPGLSSHRKFRRLALLLGSPITARGALELLWETCYDAVDDYLGTSDDIEMHVGWISDLTELTKDVIKSKRGQLTKALLQCGLPDSGGFIDVIQENADPQYTTYRVHDLWDHAPEYVRKRRDRQLSRGKDFSASFDGEYERRSADVSRRSAETDRRAAAVRLPYGRTTSPVHPSPVHSKVLSDQRGTSGTAENREPALSRLTAATAVELQAVWNEVVTLPLLPSQELSRRLRGLATYRLKERPLDEHRRAFRRINASRFCRGDNRKKWQASFDWYVKATDAAIGALEGRYDNRDDRQTKQAGIDDDVLDLCRSVGIDLETALECFASSVFFWELPEGQDGKTIKLVFWDARRLVWIEKEFGDTIRAEAGRRGLDNVIIEGLHG